MPVQRVENEDINAQPIRRALNVLAYTDIENICADMYSQMLENGRQNEVVFGNCVILRAEIEGNAVLIKQESKRGFSGIYRNGSFYEMKHMRLRELTPDDVVIMMTNSFITEWMSYYNNGDNAGQDFAGQYHPEMIQQECAIQ